MKSVLSRHTWITPRRQKILAELMALRSLGVSAATWGATAPLRDRAYGWNRLVGAAFALWRALPLIHEESPKSSPLEGSSEQESHASDVASADAEGAHLPHIHVRHANLLLDELILHNRVAYEQDRKTQQWMAGFYLNDAEERIASVLRIDLLEEIKVSKPKLDKAGIVASTAEKSITKLRLPRDQRWDHALAALRELRMFLRRKPSFASKESQE